MNEIGHFMSDIDSNLYSYNIMADLNVNSYLGAGSWRGVLGTTICDKD